MEEKKMTLKAARISANYYTQKSAAKALGVSKDTISNWERGKSYPDAQKIAMIEKVYNIKYSNIIFLSNNYANSVKQCDTTQE